MLSQLQLARLLALLPAPRQWQQSSYFQAHQLPQLRRMLLLQLSAQPGAGRGRWALRLVRMIQPCVGTLSTELLHSAPAQRCGANKPMAACSGRLAVDASPGWLIAATLQSPGPEFGSLQVDQQRWSGVLPRGRKVYLRHI